MQKKIKVTMPKSKKQLEHTHTYDGRKYMISFDPRGLKDNQRDQIHYPTEETLIKIRQEID